MRLVVTGAGNPVGQAIVSRLLADGHEVRIFGDSPEVAEAFANSGKVRWHPGNVRIGGSIEPVLSERQALVHVANFDKPVGDNKSHGAFIEMGTLYARYGAEREQVDHFVYVTPPAKGKFAPSLQKAAKTVADTRGPITVTTVEESSPDAAAAAVSSALAKAGVLGKAPGRETDAVTA